MKAEYKVKEEFYWRPDRKTGKIYRGRDIEIIETFIEAKRKYIAALLEYNEKHLKHVKSQSKLESLYNLILEKNKDLEELDKIFNKIFKRTKLSELKKEISKLQEEINFEKILLLALESRLVEISYEILKQHEICFEYYYKLEVIIERLFKEEFEYLFKTYNIEIEKNDDNYFDEEMEMKSVLRDYLYTDSYLILDTIQPKRLAKYYIKD